MYISINILFFSFLFFFVSFLSYFFFFFLLDTQGAIGTLLLVLEDASNSSLKERDEQMCAAIINDIDANFSGKLIEFLLNTNHSVQQRTLACLKQLVCSGGKHVLQMRDSLLTVSEIFHAFVLFLFRFTFKFHFYLHLFCSFFFF